ncbi:hypothetical protein [Lacipirellula limnantheis]|uniref:Uncharacterized protein n=1 Tax=Lacipirellula limnantheis TaxID=2528024 RepID=A0A517TY42_9BACT|nr:hypothetical protein [Lacipirellula limnantheis]QDT73287.1 hypothetical protein I41_24760 [Lacipirellula limnantheis]
MRNFTVLAAICAMTLTGRVSAAPLNLAHVAANAKWVAHLDLDAVRASTVVQRAWEKGTTKHPEAKNRLATVSAMLGMDPTKDIHGITFYGAGYGKAAGVMIIAGEMNSERLLGLAKVIPGRETTKQGDRELHSWRKGAKTVAAIFQSEKLLIIGASADDVGAALQVIDGDAESIAADGPLGGNIPPGTTFLLRADGIAGAKLPCRAPVVKLIDSLRMVTGESEGTSFFRARLEMTNRDATELGLQAVKGWQAQGNLLCPDELGRKFINALRPTAEGETLTLLWNAPADDVWNALQNLEKAIGQKMARRQKHAKAGGCPLCAACESGSCPLCASHDEGCPCDDCQKPQDKTTKSVAPEEDF